MITLGGDQPAHSLALLDFAWSMGIRYFDTAARYNGGNDEKRIAQWLAKHPERRKELFLVSKDYPKQGPDQMLEMIDRRLAACGTDYLDLFFIHQLCQQVYGPESVNWPKSDSFKRVVEKLKNSGKCKMVGFSCHGGPEYIQAAAEGGFVDAVMLFYSPFYAPGSEIDRAMTACHKAGIGLIAMKTLRHAGNVPKRIPEFDKLGLTTQQAVMHAVWSDPRISSICNCPQHVDHIESSVAAARSYKAPLKISQLDVLRETILAHRRTMCPGCPSCDELAATTTFAYRDIARYVSYYEQDGDLAARDDYRALPVSMRDVARVDLAALRDRCAFKTDYPDIVARAERYFS